jgi:hypothetical protein
MQFYSKYMPKLLFLSRVAFICNVCYLLSFLLRTTSFIQSGHASSVVIILGNLLAIILNIIVIFGYAICFFILKVGGPYPKWLIIINFLFLLVQSIVFFS